MNRLTRDEFIRRCTRIHGGKFDYSKTQFHKVRLFVTITCPVHGDFEQRAASHLNGNGCKHCRNDRASVKMQGNTNASARHVRRLMMRLTADEARELHLWLCTRPVTNDEPAIVSDLQQLVRKAAR